MSIESVPSIPSSAGHADPTGRHRLAFNVLASWAGHAVFVVAGFVLPRIIDRSVGQEGLGVWDFCWSLVSYFGFAEIGVGAGNLGRYVAKYRASGDTAGLRSAASSVLLVQLASAAICLAATAAVTLFLPRLFGHRLGARVEMVTPVVALLGSALAVEMSGGTFHGVIVGCHRWDLHNAITAGFHALTTAAMIASLILGGGLTGLAAIYLCGVVAREITRRAIAYRVCPELRLGPAFASWDHVRRLVLFGAKTSVPGFARLVLFQGNSLLVASQLGPAALAVFARPNALFRHVETFLAKFANVLIPTASSLQAQGRTQELSRLMLESTRFAAGLGLPLTLTLAILGDPILHVWMGPRYEQGLVVLILAAGFFPMLTQQPAVTILTGLNAHGRLGIASLASSILGLGLSLVFVRALGWGLPGAALAVAVPLSLGGGLFVAVAASHRLGLSVTRYLRQSYLSPILCAIPFAACLSFARIAFADRPLASLIVGSLSGGMVIAPLTWYFVLPRSARAKAAQLVSGLAPRVRRADRT
jgi:O-antigen/teichoic acid export membrane protein